MTKFDTVWKISNYQIKKPRSDKSMEIAMSFEEKVLPCLRIKTLENHKLHQEWYYWTYDSTNKKLKIKK